jgi:hypothetical protein
MVPFMLRMSAEHPAYPEKTPHLVKQQDVTACRLNNRHEPEKCRIALFTKMLQRVG